MNPGIGIWSEAVYNHLKPKRHILLEHDARYYPALADFTTRNPNSSLVKLNGHDWETYDAVFSSGPFHEPTFPSNYQPCHPRTVPIDEGLNPDLLFIGNLTTRSESQRLLSQFLESCSGPRTWLQKFGRVRFLIWIFDSEKERIFPKVMQSRMRGSVLADTFAEVHEVAGSGVVRTGQGFSRNISEKANSETAKKFQLQMNQITKRLPKIRERLDRAQKVAASAEKVTPYMQRRIQSRIDEELELFRKVLGKIAKLSRSYEPLNGVDIEKLSIEECHKIYQKLQDDPPTDFYSPIEVRYSDEAYEEQNQKLAQTPGAYQPTAEEAALFAEYEQTHSQFHQLTRIARSIPDERYARSLSPPLLQAWRDEGTTPVPVKPADVLPTAQLALMDFQPKVPPSYLRPDTDSSDTSLAMARYEMYDWLIRILFSTRAQTVKSALAGLAPGAACILEELGQEGVEIGKKRVRVLTIDELIKLAWAWEQWDFKPEELKWGEVSRLEEQKQTLGYLTG